MLYVRAQNPTRTTATWNRSGFPGKPALVVQRSLLGGCCRGSHNVPRALSTPVYMVEDAIQETHFGETLPCLNKAGTVEILACTLHRFAPFACGISICDVPSLRGMPCRTNFRVECQGLCRTELLRAMMSSCFPVHCVWPFLPNSASRPQRSGSAMPI